MENDQDADAGDDIEDRHEGDGLFRNGGDPLEAAGDSDEHRDAEEGEDEALVDAERLVDRVGERLALGQVGPGPGDDAPQADQEAADLPAHGVAHDERALAHELVGGFIPDAVSLPEDNLGRLGGHAHQSGDPHPDDGAGAAIVTAVATPAMFPTPTVLASAVHPAAKLEMVPSPFSPFLKSLPMEFWNMNLRENWYLNLNLIVM